MHWKSSCERDQQKVDEKFKKQEASTRAAYTKDEQFWRKHQIDRVKKKSESGGSGSGQQSDKSGWADVPQIELVVVPEEEISDNDLNNAMDETSKNANPSAAVHPPGDQVTSSTGAKKKTPLPATSITTRRSERNSSTSHPSI